MRKNQRFAFLAIGGLGLLAAIAPGLAAGLQVNTPASGVPAAGQGAIAVQGFVVENINWTVEDAGTVAEVTFDIYRGEECDTDGLNCASSSVADANATVRASLNDGVSNWVTCAVTAGAAECNTATLNIDANDLVEVEVLAFDSN
jgi:hypothetical protein